jgi:hypothetical protein
MPDMASWRAEIIHRDRKPATVAKVIRDRRSGWQPTGNGLKKRSADLSPTGPPLASFLRLLVLFVPEPGDNL